MTFLTTRQYDYLIRPIDPSRVQHLRGQSHLEQWDVRRTLIRVFGFGGFDVETLRCELIRELEYPPGSIARDDESTNNRTLWTVIYRAEVRLIIKTPDGTVIARYDDGATGDGINQPNLGDAHDLAMKSALSQALKRCAVNLGDQFGLSLYNGGLARAVVVGTYVAPARVAGQVEDHTAAEDLPSDVAPELAEAAA